MIEFEKVIKEKQADLVVLVGDVDSKIGCSLNKKKLRVKAVHVEAGLRSFDMSIPDENAIINTGWFILTHQEFGD